MHVHSKSLQLSLFLKILTCKHVYAVYVRDKIFSVSCDRALLIVISHGAQGIPNKF